jgi:CDP-diacylglycerol---glycerol-3-phosphate 3-phosphatidyltransferase
MRYRARHLLLPPSLISLLRVPLAACFPFVVGRPALAFAVLATAGITDVIDGWVARRYGLATATGAAVDPITDKLFVLTVAVTLVLDGLLSPMAVLLLSVREIGELPLVAWFAVTPSARRARADPPQAHVPGKLAKVFQFLTVGWILLRRPHVEFWLAATAVAGMLAAVSYWRRAVR